MLLAELCCLFCVVTIVLCLFCVLLLYFVLFLGEVGGGGERVDGLANSACWRVWKTFHLPIPMLISLFGQFEIKLLVYTGQESEKAKGQALSG